MAFSYNEDGKLVRLVEQEVNEDGVEAELQAQLDEAQNEVNSHQANVSQSEQQLADLDAQHEQVTNERNAHQINLEAAQTKLQKSEAEKASLTAARELRDAGDGANAEGEADSDAGEPADDESVPESEEVAVPVTVAAAEG